MQAILTTVIIAAISLGAGAAFAKGGNDNRDDVKRDIAEARKHNAANDTPMGGIFSFLFGDDEMTSAKADTADSTGKSAGN
ncbi:MAG: hypothetical protein AAGD47_01010 [Pseudomonadota bacterium]